MAVAAAAVTVVVLTAMMPARAAGAGTAPGMTSAPSTPAVPSSAVAEPAPTGVVVADDPVAATTALMTARDRCLSSLSLRCLDQVDEPGSSALEADQAAIRAVQQGGELPDPGAGTDDGPPVLIERLGDSALVQVGGAASASSLLLVKGGEGWRIRDVIPPDEAGSPPTG